MYCFLLRSQIAKPQLLGSSVEPPGKALHSTTSKEELPKEDEPNSGIPRSFSDSTQAGHLLPPMDGMNTYPIHKRHASVGTQSGRIALPTHTRSSSMDKR